MILLFGIWSVPRVQSILFSEGFGEEDAGKGPQQATNCSRAEPAFVVQSGGGGECEEFGQDADQFAQNGA